MTVETSSKMIQHGRCLYIGNIYLIVIHYDIQRSGHDYTRIWFFFMDIT